MHRITSSRYCVNISSVYWVIVLLRVNEGVYLLNLSKTATTNEKYTLKQQKQSLFLHGCFRVYFTLILLLII